MEIINNVGVDVGIATKHPANPLFGQEYPWEPRYDNMYPNVIWDNEDNLYKCWYSPFVVYKEDKPRSTPERTAWSYRESGVCYAVSDDGIIWRKPLLDEFKFDGRPSNLIYRNAAGVGVFKDSADTNAARRYKMFFLTEDKGQLAGLGVAFSRDGIHWSKPQALGDLSLRADTHNNAIWAPSIGQYVGISRDWSAHRAAGVKRVRLVARVTSNDFVRWSSPQIILRGETDELQTYAMPIFYYEGLYFGMPAIFDVRQDRVHVELAWSRDTATWTRIAPRRPLIGNGIGYDWGCIFAAASPIVTPSGIRLYYAASDGTHGGSRRGFLALATLRPDGFAGLKNLDDRAEGEFVTKPMEIADVISSQRIHLTADIALGGKIEIMILDPRKGHVIAKSSVIEGERHLTAFAVELKMCETLTGDRVRVRIVLQRAMVYSFGG